MTWEELRPLLIEGLAVLIASVVLWRKQHQTARKVDENSRKVDENTTVTEQAVAAAEKAAEQVDWQQRATAYKAELDMANRKLALVEGLPDCQDCRLKIRDVLAGKPVERRRTDPPPPHEGQP